jgi:hypothetical protein
VKHTLEIKSICIAQSGDIVAGRFKLVMGICHIFKIDDRYANIDWWSIICDNSLLNVFTEHNYSNRLYFKSMFHEVKIWLKLYHIFTNYNFSSANIVRTKQNTGFHILNIRFDFIQIFTFVKHIFGLVYYLSTARNSPFYIRCYIYGNLF